MTQLNRNYYSELRRHPSRSDSQATKEFASLLCTDHAPDIDSFERGATVRETDNEGLLAPLAMGLMLSASLTLRRPNCFHYIFRARNQVSTAVEYELLYKVKRPIWWLVPWDCWCR
jgi:hypothetical protein